MNSVLRPRWSDGSQEVPRRRWNSRLLLAVFVALVSVVSYFSNTAVNPITGEKQRVGMSFQQEVALGLRAAPEMAAQHGGLDQNLSDQARVRAVGAKLLQAVPAKIPYEFRFHLLRDPKTVNAFALPGGQVFITRALYDQLKTEDQLAGVLAHEVGHVLERHSAQQLAKAQLTQGLTGAAVLATYDPNNPGAQNRAVVAQMVAQLVTMRFGRQDEIESDRWGVRLAGRAGYDPRAMIDVMEILHRAASGPRPPEFLSTHPSSEHRIREIEEAIRAEFPS